LLSASLLSAQPDGRGERYRLFQDYLIRRAAEITRAFPGNIGSLEEWKRRRPELRRQVFSMLGFDRIPEKTPLNVQITGTLERDTYRIEKIVFQSMPGFYVTGNLYLPKESKGKFPAVLYLCGHSPGPSGNKVDYQHHGIWLARHGYVAFLIDSVEFGEVPGIHHGTHDLEMWEWLSLGYTPVAPEVWNSIRAVDYLETRPEVDASKIAVTGISGGGAMTWYSAAVDERLKVAAPVCSTWTVHSHTADDAVHENCDCIYFLNTFLADLPMVGALIAPRPLKIISARRDVSFPIPGYRDVYQRIRPIYELYGAADKIAEYDEDAPHADIVPFRKEANEWINRWIKGDKTPFVEGEIKPEQPSTLAALDRYPPDAVNGHIHKTFVRSASPAAPASLGAWNKRRTALLAEIKDKSLRALPASKVPFNPVKTPTKDWSTRYSGGVFRVEFATEEGLRVNGQLFLPRDPKPPHPALIYVKGARDVVYPIDYDALLGVLRTHVVLVLHPRAVDYPIDNYKSATIKRTAALLGATIESMQMWDILRSIDYLREAEGLKLSSVSIYARKEMAVPAIYAAATDERISRVILDDPPYSHWQGPAMLNALRFTDLPEVAALIAPREIVSLGPLPKEYALTSAVYGFYGGKGAIREAHALPDALRVWEQR
jgi:cephalosporin-C deacetylase-like acetyl esterase